MIIEHNINGNILRFNASGLVSVKSRDGESKVIDLDEVYGTAIGPITATAVLVSAGFPHIDRVEAGDTKLAMTSAQKTTLDFIKSYIAKTGGISPSYLEIMQHLGLASKSGVYRIIAALEDRGHIERAPSLARTIVLKG